MDDQDEEPRRWEPAPGTVPGPTPSTPPAAPGTGAHDRPEPAPPPETAPVPPFDPHAVELDPTLAIAGVDAADPHQPPSGPPTPPAGIEGLHVDEDDDGNGEDGDGSRRRAIIIGIILAVLVLIALVIIALRVLSSGDDATPATTTVAETTTTTEPQERRIDLFGVTVVIPVGSLEPQAHLVAELRDLPTSHVRGFVPVSPFLSVGIEDGEQLGPIRFEYPVSDRPLGPSGADPVLLALRVDGEDVEVLDGRWEPASRRYVVEVDDVSDLGVVTWDWDRIDGAVRAATASVSAEPGPAGSCADPPDEIRVGGEGAVEWCAEEQDDLRIVRFRNTTPHVVSVRREGGRLSEVEDDSDIGAIAARVPGWNTDDRLLIGPGGRARFEVAREAEAGLASSFDEAAAAATRFRVDAAVLAELSGLLPAADRLEVSDVMEAVDPSCLAGVDGGFFGSCFVPEDVARWVGAPVSAHLGGILRPEILGRLVDASLDGEHARFVTDSAGEVGVAPVEIRSWPTGSHDAEDDLLDVIDEEDMAEPRWSSCLADLCLVDAGDVVGVWEHDGEEWHLMAEIDTDVEDPAAALDELGLGAEEIDALLRS